MPSNIVEQLNQHIPPEYIAFGLALTALSGSFYFIWGLVGPVVKWIKDQTYQLSYRELETYVADDDYIKFNMWLESNKEHTYFQRHFKVVNPLSRHDDDVRENAVNHVVAGFGTVIVKAPGLPLITVTRTKIESKQVYEQTEQLTFRIFAISQTSVQKFYDQVSKVHTGYGPSVYSPASWHWTNIGTPKKVLPPISAGSQELLTDIKTFLDSEQMYADRGIPYKRGYMLYGPPGTGKSSVVAHIANTFDMNVYQLNSEGIMKFADLRRSVKRRSIILIEDIDMTVAGNESRKNINIIGNKTDDDDNETIENKNVTRETMREFLNTLDGICEFSGSVVMITTNQPDALDPALIRPGRIDRRISIGPYTKEEQLAHISKFFGVDLDPKKYDVKERTVAETQFLCLNHMDNIDKVISAL